MSAPSTSAVPSRSLKWTWAFLIAILVPALQVGLPWLSCYLASDSEDADRTAMGLSDQRSFWALRFSFDRFLHPRVSLEGDYFVKLSGAVCRDELIVMTVPTSNDSNTISKIDRIHLRTGLSTTSPGPAGIIKLLSDGEKLWSLTDRDGGKRAFLYQGRVARFQPRNIGPDDTAQMTHELEWFEDEKWKPTGQFALIPFYQNLYFDTDLSTGELCCVLEDAELWFQCGLKLQSRDEHLLELQRYLEIEPTDVTKASKSAGWHPLPKPSEFDNLLWYWSQNNVLSALYPAENTSHSHGFNRFRGFRWYQVSKEVQLREQDLDWPIDPVESVTMDQIHLVKAYDGLYFVVRDTLDGRWTVYRWDSGHLVRLVDQRSPALGITCLDAALFVDFAFVIPTIILALAAAWIRRRFPARHEIALEIEMASITRRGLARTIDLLSWSVPLTLSAALHPLVIVWWYRAYELGIDYWPRLWSLTVSLCSDPSWGQLALVRMVAGWIVELYLSIPLIRPLAALALVVLIAQFSWQCWSGQSLGKWIMGIRVVRTDLRQCGWGRCLVREALLLVDGLLFLSWVPGVICLLITAKSQRIGDLFPDTIVIRNARPASSRSR